MSHPAGGGTVPLSHANVTLSNQSGPDLLPLPDEVRIAEITVGSCRFPSFRKARLIVARMAAPIPSYAMANRPKSMQEV